MSESEQPTSVQTRYATVAMASVVLAFLLVFLEGVVRIAGSALDCGESWFLCTTRPEALLSWTTVVEFSLRGSVTGLIVALALLLVHGWRLRQQHYIYLVLPSAAVTFALAIAGVTIFSQSLPGMLIRVALVQMALAILVVTAAVAIVRANGIKLPGAGGLSRFGWITAASGVGVFGLIVAGSAIGTLESAADACTNWPICDGRLFPNGISAVDLHLSHRWVALLATIGILVAASIARVRYQSTPAIRGLINAAAALMAAQILIGAVTVWSEQNPVSSAAHLGVAGVIWGLLVGAVALDRLLPVPVPAPAAMVHREPRAVFADYVEFTKPRIMVLLLITTLGGMLIAAAGWPGFGLIFWTMLGGGLSAGGASALNHYIDRDIDGLMTRTRSRPLPAGRVAPVQTAIFGVTLSVLAIYILVIFVNPLAALLALTGNIAYVVMYTKYLKRATPQNIVLGGAAGAVPPMVGWAAVTGTIGVPALLLFAIIFYWTPPHFWALALFKRGDYEAARVPMFPEVYGDAETRRHILLYTVMLVIVSLFPFALQYMGLFYLACAAILGGIFLLRTWQLTTDPGDQAARRVFFFSLIYLALIFLAMVLDRMIWFS